MILNYHFQNGWVGFRKITLKKTMTAEEFYNGYLSKGHHEGEIFQSLDNTINKYILRTKVEL